MCLLCTHVKTFKSRTFSLRAHFKIYINKYLYLCGYLYVCECILISATPITHCELLRFQNDFVEW